MSSRKVSSTVPSHVGREGLALVNGEEQSVNLDEIMTELGVHWTIKLHPDDFENAKNLLKPSEGAFAHFNLGDTVHIAGESYALVPILRSGDVQKQPLVDYSQSILVTCERLVSEVDYSEIAAADFEHSLPDIKSRDDLRKVMCSRYCASRGLTEDEIYRHPVTLTMLRKI